MTPSTITKVTTVHHSEHVMGTVVTFDLYDAAGISQRQLSPYLTRAIASLHRADKIFSTWKAESPMSQLRRGEIALGEAPEEIIDVLTQCQDLRKVSRGWFDPWALAGGVDPTGFVKGWAAERALDVLREAPISGAMVNAAGDIASFGGPTTSQAFRVAIVAPGNTTQLATVVDLRGAIATSGTYERGEHLIDPHTRIPVTRAASASVCGPDLGVADALATALAVGGDEVLAIIEELAGYEAFTIAGDGERNWTVRFPFARSDIA